MKKSKSEKCSNFGKDLCMKYALFCQNESCKSKWHPECLFRKYSVHTLTDDTCNFDLYVTLIKMIAKILQVFLVFFDFSEMTLNIIILMKRHTFIRISRPPLQKMASSGRKFDCQKVL